MRGASASVLQRTGTGQSSRGHTSGIPHQTPNPLHLQSCTSSSPPLLIIQKRECLRLLAKTSQFPDQNSRSGPHTQGAPVQGHSWGLKPSSHCLSHHAPGEGQPRGAGVLFSDLSHPDQSPKRKKDGECRKKEHEN